MALKDYHLSGESGGSDGGDVTESVWKCQTFTPLSSYSSTSVAIKAYRSVGASGTITIALREANGVDGNGFTIPSGGNLASGTINISDLTTDSSAAWYIATLSAAVALTVGTRYAIIISASVTGYVYFKGSITSNYAFGQRGLSNNAGGIWNIIYPSQNTSDFLFKIYDASTYTPQLIVVAGSLSGGKHLWKLIDDGSENLLVIDNSYALPGDVECMAYSSATRRLFIGIGTSVYCYDVDEITLISSWGTSGQIDLGVTIKNIVVDSSDYLAIAHNNTGSNKKITLLDETGLVVWQAGDTNFGTNGLSVSFSVNGNINAGFGPAGTAIEGAARLSRTDGSVLITYYTGGGAGSYAFGIESNKDTETYCYVSRSGSSPTGLHLYNDTSLIGTEPFVAVDVIHSSNLDMVFYHTGSNNIRMRNDDFVVSAHTWADYSGVSFSPLPIISVYGIDKNDDTEEIYVVGYSSTHGSISVCSPTFSVRTSLEVSFGSILGAVAWVGDQYVIPVISDQSSDTTADEGDLVEFFVTATGIPSPTYQWYKDDVLIDGETNSTITFSSVNRTDAGTYKCTVTNVAGAVDSSPIILTVYYSEITAQSSDSVFGIGQLMTLTVTAIGNPVPTYQWYKDDILISGAVSSSYSKYTVLSDAGTYKCKVSNAVGDIYTTDIVVSIVVNPYVLGINLNLDMDRG